MLQFYVFFYKCMVWVESCICSVYVVDDRVYVIYDGGKIYDGQQEVFYYEEVFFFSGWQRRIVYGGQDQCGEVKVVEVLASQAFKVRLCGIRVYLGVTFEVQVFGQGKVQVVVLMDDNKNVKYQFGNAKGVWVSCAGFCAVKGFKEAGCFQKAVQFQCGCVRVQL